MALRPARCRQRMESAGTASSSSGQRLNRARIAEAVEYLTPGFPGLPRVAHHHVHNPFPVTFDRAGPALG
jgi:tRNA(Ile2) C34 agmatinyltransferase TiaS